MVERSHGAGLKVLVIDDDPGVCNTLTMLLGEEGFEVLTAMSGEEGIGVAREDNPDIILLDIEMPGLDGPKVCRILKEDPQTADIPIVFLTAKLNLDAMEVTLDGVTQGYIMKPFSQYDLLDKIDEVLDLSS